MIDISKYLALRYGENETFHRNPRHIIKTSCDLDRALSKLNKLKNVGILLSGGMDSALVAKYVDKDTIAFTFKYDNDFAIDEYNRAVSFAQENGLQLVDINISWDTIKDTIIPLIKYRGGPIATIEPQIYLACKLAKEEYDIDQLIIGGDADIVFGGLDILLTTDWTLNSFMDFFVYNNPEDILKEPTDLYKYTIRHYWDSKNNKFDIIKFIEEVYETESTKSYDNPSKMAKSRLIDPFTDLYFKFDIEKIKEKPKYIIQELFEEKYGYTPPRKNPMPRPVDFYEELNKYPKSDIFREDIDYSKLTGQQKWMIYCVDKYLEIFNDKC